MPSLGSPGSEVVAELNRLANGGVYPSPPAALDAAGAANRWAGTAGLEVVGALNAKNGTSGLEMQGVCNALAGTSGLGPAEALREIAA